jgi:hypothetical protein
MKTKIISAVLLISIILSGCGFWGVRGNGKLKDETRKIMEFNRIDAGGAFTIIIKVGQSPSVKITGEENLLSYIRTNVRGNTLVIDTKKSISPRKEIVIHITTPKLESIDASGANNVIADGISAEEFEVSLSGAGTIDIKGESLKLKAEISGAGTIDAKDLKAEDVKISVSGAANAEVYASKSINATVSGVGSINYYGDPKDVKTNVSGVGSISRK